MNKVLWVTVGGSFQPIVTAINQLQPDRIIFVCSDGSKGSKSQIVGEGTPCEVRKGTEVVEKLPNIPTQLKLGDKFQQERDLVLIQNPDDLSECYEQIANSIRQGKQELPSGKFLADYTGGTKTMSAALVMAAIDYQVTAYLTTSSSRPNLIKVESGERARRAPVSSLTINRTIEQIIPTFLQQYNYPAAIAELQNLLQNTESPPPYLEQTLDICEGFNAWDKFDHIGAWNYLKPYLKNPELKPLILFLKKVMGSRQQLAPGINDDFQAPETIKGHGYEIVEDLLLNAERRAVLDRFDDAVARLYRALELLEQVRLWEGYQIKTGDVELSKIPESIRPDYQPKNQQGKIQLALAQSYVLLSRFPEDPLGKLYLANQNQIQNALQIRNNSIFAHGLKPVDKNSYHQKFREIVVPFIKNGILALTGLNKLDSQQFPQVIVGGY